MSVMVEIDYGIHVNVVGSTQDQDGYSIELEIYVNGATDDLLLSGRTGHCRLSRIDYSRRSLFGGYPHFDYIGLFRTLRDVARQLRDARTTIVY